MHHVCGKVEMMLLPSCYQQTFALEYCVAAFHIFFFLLFFVIQFQRILLKRSFPRLYCAAQYLLQTLNTIRLLLLLTLYRSLTYSNLFILPDQLSLLCY